MKKVGILGTLIISLAIMSFVSAEMSISQPASLYNVGDKFNVNVVLSEKTNLNDIFITKIICNDENNGTKESEIYRMPVSVIANQPKTIVVEGYAADFLINGMRGKCSFVASFANEKVTSQAFEISDEISVTAGFEKFLFNPGEEVKVSGKAVKKNGQLVNGFSEVVISDLGVDYVTDITKGALNFSFYIPDKAKAKEYRVLIRVYEKDDFGEKITNQGEFATSLAVRQVLSRADIAVNSETIKPGNNLTYTIVLFDQAGDMIEKQNIYARVYAPDGYLFEEKLAKSNEMNIIPTKTNFAPGIWRIETSSGNITAEKKINIEELEMIDYELENDILTITNIGNVPYKKSVEISIGKTKEIEEINLNVGESKRLVLKAPDGEYSISVNDGYKEKSLGSTLLTGSAISVDEEGEGFIDKSFIWMWIVLFALMGMILIYHFARVSKIPYIAFSPREKEEAKIKPINLANIKISGKGNLLDEGVRELCTVVAIKIKNMNEIMNDNAAMGAIENVMMKARERNGKTYSNENSKTIVFSPAFTKNEEKNSFIGVMAAKEFENILKSYNEGAKIPIKFGIGVNVGEMIRGVEGDKVKFVPIGNTLVNAREIAERVMQEVGISGNAHRKLLGKIKAEKIEGDNFWRVNKVVERENNSEFINRFLDRQRKEARDAAIREKRMSFSGNK